MGKEVLIPPTTRAPRKAAVMAVEIIKACRSAPLSRGEIAQELGTDYMVIDAWVRVFADSGLLVVTAEPLGDTGRLVLRFQVSPAWRNDGGRSNGRRH